MKPWQFAVVGLALLANSGCRSDPAIPLLERELRLKEDEIYRLRGTVEDLQDVAASSERRAHGPARDDSDSRDTRADRKASSSVPTSVAPPVVGNLGPASSEMPATLKNRSGPPPGIVPEVPENLRGPSPIAPPTNAPDAEMDDRPRGLDEGADKLPTGPADGPALGGPLNDHGAARGTRGRFVSRDRQMSAAGDSRQVASIALDRELSGGVNEGGREGDKGLLVVVEPRDAQGRSMDAPGDISVAVLDPAVLDQEGYAARVARWDFTAADAAQMFRHTATGPAIHIETAWPDGQPAHNRLHLFVRYTTADGRQLDANQPIEVALAGEKSARRSHEPDQGAPQSPMARDTGRPAASLAQRPAWSPER